MAKWTSIFFSKEHDSPKNGNKHIDVQRRQSDRPKSEKIGHSKSSDGYNSNSVKIPVNKNK